ncbi:hypothetical protein J2P12_07430, partial [Candidatus Bathyarchaeota archaeon]|nr:hypothetical protein [Candidatus Bathyarchaeota archaeon]
HGGWRNSVIAGLCIVPDSRVLTLVSDVMIDNWYSESANCSSHTNMTETSCSCPTEWTLGEVPAGVAPVHRQRST